MPEPTTNKEEELNATMENKRHTWDANWRFFRDIILFFGGLGGVAHETFVQEPNPTLLIVYGAMMGLPAFLRSDEKKG